MSTSIQTVLIVGATGSIGHPAVAEALRQGYRVRALVRDARRAQSLPADIERVIGDLTVPATLAAALEGADAVVFVHGTTTRESDVRDIDYTGVANILKALGGRKVRIALMTAVGVTRPGVPFAAWKLRSERLVRASGNAYTIVRPGWFDYNDADQRRIVMLQGDNHQTGGPADGVIARDQIARVLIDSLSSDAATSKTFELSAEQGTEQDELDAVFASLAADKPGDVDGVDDRVRFDPAKEPSKFTADLAAIRGRD